MLFKSVQTFRDYTTKNSKLFLLLAFLSKVTAYRVKSHLNRVLSYLSLSIKTSVVLCSHSAPYLKPILKVLPGYCNHLFLQCVQNWCHGSHLKLHIGSCSEVGHEGGEPGRVHDQVQPWQWRPGRR